MPKYDETIYGTPCWVDLTSTDLERVKPFYAALFNWSFTDTGEDFGHYNIISVGEDVVGGTMQYNPEFMGPVPIDAWSVYFATENVEDAIARAVDLGGKGYTEAMEIGDQGTSGEVTDPSGALIGLWQPNQRKGFDRWGEHGFPGWFELHTRDFEGASQFYPAFLGVEIATEPMGEGMRYGTLNVNGNATAGIWDIKGVLPEEAPSLWNVYLIVDDTDAAVETARQHGGAVMTEPEDSPYGRMSTLQDPAGASFIVISSV